MYDSPTFVSLCASKSSEFARLQIHVFYENVKSFIAGVSGRNSVLEQTFREMTLPDKNVVNIGLSMYAQQILFLSAIEDLRRDGLLNRTVCSEDIHAVNTFRQSLTDMVKLFYSCDMDRRDSIYYRRDILPLIGCTVKTQLLDLA